MENSIDLIWKEFSVPVDKLNLRLKEILGHNYDGFICGPESFTVVFNTSPTEGEQDTLISYWDGVTESQFSPTIRDVIQQRINDSSVFGRSLILDFMVENVELGITQADKTIPVADYLFNLQRYVESGSLYAAIAEIDRLLNAGVPSNLSPFVTVDRLNTYKAKINVFIENL